MHVFKMHVVNGCQPQLNASRTRTLYYPAPAFAHIALLHYSKATVLGLPLGILPSKLGKNYASNLVL